MEFIPTSFSLILHQEPGYYEAGEFGIRIENVVLIKPAETKVGCVLPRACLSHGSHGAYSLSSSLQYNYGGTGYLTMEPVTLVSSLHYGHSCGEWLSVSPCWALIPYPQVPIQSKMIVPSLLTQEEVRRLDCCANMPDIKTSQTSSRAQTFHCPMTWTAVESLGIMLEKHIRLDMWLPEIKNGVNCIPLLYIDRSNYPENLTTLCLILAKIQCQTLYSV